MATVARDRPVLFSGPMVRALLSGHKTQTRRVVFKDDPDCHMPWRVAGTHWQDGDDALRCPYGEPGDRLWVREAWRPCLPNIIEYKCDEARIEYSGDLCRTLTWDGPRFRPSIHMPRWASRITLEITGVRVERLQRIKLSDVAAEGVPPDCEGGWDSTDGFRELWERINGKRAPWDRNPWVWAVTFSLVSKGGA